MPPSNVNKQIAECEALYPNKYSYSKVLDEYTTVNSKVTIKCKKHDVEFQQSMYVLKKFDRNRCFRCQNENKPDKNKVFQEKVQLLFPDLMLDFTNTKYINSSTKVTIACKYHGEMVIIPNSFMSSRYGCKACGEKKSCNAKS